MRDEVTVILDEDVWDVIVRYEPPPPAILSDGVREKLRDAARLDDFIPTRRATRHITLAPLKADELLIWLTSVRLRGYAPQDACRRAIFAVREAQRL